MNTPESVFAADIYCHSKCIMQYVICQNSQKQHMVLFKLNQMFRGNLSHVYPLYEDGYGLTVTEIKDFMFSLAESYDTELYNKDVNTNILDNYGEITEFCPSYREILSEAFEES